MTRALNGILRPFLPRTKALHTYFILVIVSHLCRLPLYTPSPSPTLITHWFMRQISWYRLFTWYAAEMPLHRLRGEFLARHESAWCYQFIRVEEIWQMQWLKRYFKSQRQSFPWGFLAWRILSWSKMKCREDSSVLLSVCYFIDRNYAIIRRASFLEKPEHQSCGYLIMWMATINVHGREQILLY